MLDIGSGKADSVLTADNMLQIIGNLINIDGTALENGVFFVDQSNQAKTKATFIATNSPKNLIPLIPTLPIGDYKVKVVTQYSGSYLLKAAKTIPFDKILTVA